MNTSRLLTRASCQIVEHRQNLRAVQDRQAVSQALLENYVDYNSLRMHLFHPHERPHLNWDARHPLLSLLQNHSWICSPEPNRWTLHHLTLEERFYLQGGWLEELLYLGHVEAGCDEVYLGAKLHWMVNGTEGTNEVDVLARRGDILSFTSCKCVHPQTERTHEQLRQFMLEVAYWNTHFAADQGRAVLAVTADLLDECHANLQRYPALHARAQVVDVDVLGLEALSWETLVQTLRAHWTA
jgi:hypothetical protein